MFPAGWKLGGIHTCYTNIAPSPFFGVFYILREGDRKFEKVKALIMLQFHMHAPRSSKLMHFSAPTFLFEKNKVGTRREQCKEG